MPQFFKFFFVLILFSTNVVTTQEIVEKNTDSLKIIDIKLYSAQKNIENFNYANAKNELEIIIKEAKSIKNKKRLGIAYSKLGKVQFFLEFPNQATKTLIKAIEIQRLEKDYANIAETYKTIGDVYMSLKKPTRALGYYKFSEIYFNQELLFNYKTEAILKKGKAHLALEDYTNAEAAFKEAISLSKYYKLSKIQSSAYLCLGKVQLINNKLDYALKNVTDGFKIARENKYSYLLNNSYLLTSNIQEAKGNYKLANAALKAHLKLSDSLAELKKNHLKNNLSIINPIVNYQKQAKADLEEETRSTSIDKYTKISGYILTFILFILTMLLYRNNKTKLKSNNDLQKKNSELIISKEKAELASKTKANFLSTVTHELRTPLYAVTGLTNVLLDENPKPTQVEHLKSLKFSGEYLLDFINDILQINKIEANKTEIENEAFDLKMKINNIISALDNSALNNNTKLHFEYDEELPNNFNADQLKISQILINLIGNSIKFTKNGDIWVRAKKIEQKNNIYSIRFEVEDNGIGISEERQEYLFDSFSQGSIQINREYGGTGLGLSIVKKLIDILKGKIQVKSQLGKGSNFFFEIPLEFAEKVAINKFVNRFENIDETVLNKIKVLVVEDNKINQMITKKVLNKMRINCDVASSGEEAIDKIKSTNYNAVLMDIHMPGISGIEATKIIRTFDLELPVFALTAVTIEDRMVDFENAGFTDIISKPFKQEDFEKKLFKALILKVTA